MNPHFTTTLAATTVIALALGLFAATPFQLRAQATGTAKGGGTRLMELTAPRQTTPKAVEAPKAMKCKDCANITSSVRDSDPKGAGARALLSGKAPTRQVVRHGCATCKNEWRITGHGKAKTSTPVHKCEACG
jgi:hypothetical protein